MIKAISSFIFHKLMGWKLVGAYNEIPDKCLFICVPHTSWHDFYHGLLIRTILKKEIGYLGKKELFDSWMGWFFKATGGVPVDRKSKQNYVQKLAAEINSRPICRIALAPEATRRRVTTFKTGFYYIARAANIPIVMVTFDYENKQHNFSKPIFPSEDIEEDLKIIYAFFDGVRGKVPAQSFYLD